MVPCHVSLLSSVTTWGKKMEPIPTCGGASATFDGMSRTMLHAWAGPTTKRWTDLGSTGAGAHRMPQSWPLVTPSSAPPAVPMARVCPLPSC
eukprot:NODE_11943_length_1256_cov_3.666962.p5 GENE.NODE_11943_length_1256_cov_3.666962~~NODE_11943_length_1256_cov_3.666962.p5  ORF type:complete len:92 (-),score=9.45 NODE_11943_length_1256_cov_3.666962:426-701(-)